MPRAFSPVARPAARAAVVAWLAAATLGAAANAQAPGAAARDAYAAALARERNVRTAMALQSAGNETISPINDIRAAIASYERIVWKYPTSGYSDNALWQAGGLARDAFARYGEERDREVGIRLFTSLSREYPFSKLARIAREQARLLTASAVLAAGQPERLPEGAQTAGKAGQPPTPEPPRSVDDLVMIRKIGREASGDAVRVTVELDRAVAYEEQRLDSPPRLLFDLKGTRLSPDLVDATFSYDSGLVRGIRVGRHPAATTRIVLDIEDAATHIVTTSDQPFRFIITCSSATAAPTASDNLAEPERSTLAAVDLGLTAPLLPSVPATAAFEEAAAPAEPGSTEPPAPTEALGPAALPAASATTLRGSHSMARQLGLGVARIVIDPGHGGHDPGAESRGISEASVVLDVALKLEQILVKQRGVEVILTRRSDVFVPLEERTAIANREEADLFLSIHANASRREKARGAESYYLSFSATPEAAEVAERENATSGRTMNDLPAILKTIAWNNKLDESKALARLLQQAIARRLRTASKGFRDLGVKQAPFVVLIGAAMPSALVEVSFLTNRQEGTLLATRTYRQRIAEALAEGVRRYQESLKRAQTTAPQ